MSVETSLKQAATCIKRGDIAAARAIYEDILGKFPANKRVRVALEALRTPKLTKQDVQELKLIAQMLGQNRIGEVIQRSTAFVSRHPTVFDGWNILGVAAAQSRDLTVARRALENAVALRADNAEAHNNLGNVLNGLGCYDQALGAFDQAIAVKPNFALALNNKGNALMGLEAWPAAVECYTLALSHSPNYAEAHLNLGKAYGKLHNLTAQKTSLQRAVELAPQNALGRLALAEVLSKLSQPQDALVQYDAALALRPHWREALIYKGAHLKNNGHVDAAAACYEQILEHDPTCGEAYRQLSDLKTYGVEDQLTQTLEAHWASGDTSPLDRCQMGFALYKIYERAKKYDRAFDILSKANALRRADWSYTIDRDRALFAQIKELQTQIADLAVPQGAGSPKPIFVLGMPRSGTSLIEQIVSAHHNIDGAGELPYLYEASRPFLRSNEAVTQDMINTLRDTYLRQLAQHTTKGAWVTDKMPQNFLLIGLIKAALPEAKILHITRDAGAICWSNFKSYFGGTGMGHAYNLEDTVTYFQLYQDLMTFWKDLFADDIVDVDYDALVQDPEHHTQQLITDLGLEWDPACLEPHKNERAVRTVSKLQVRSEIYTGSSKAWRKYAAHLEDVFAPLYSDPNQN